MPGSADVTLTPRKIVLCALIRIYADGTPCNGTDALGLLLLKETRVRMLLLSQHLLQLRLES